MILKFDHNNKIEILHNNQTFLNSCHTYLVPVVYLFMEIINKLDLIDNFN
jgi:hypothetical protein